MEVTYADIHAKHWNSLYFTPKIHIDEGIARFCIWFCANKDWLLTLKDGK